jgi:hypothetical protein
MERRKPLLPRSKKASPFSAQNVDEVPNMQDFIPWGYTGFRVVLSGGKLITESQDSFCPSLGRVSATNWHTVPLNDIQELSLVHHGRIVVSIQASEAGVQSPGDWYYSRSAVTESGNWKTTMVSRNIGYRKDGVLRIWKVHEDSGHVHYTEQASH